MVTSCNSKKTINSSDTAETISLSKNPCFGSCPVYSIKIQKNGNIQLVAKEHVKNNLKGIYTSTLSKEDLDFINSIHFKLLENNYGNKNVSDLPSTDIEVHFPDGQSKKINDYGNHGTPELEKLYEQIEVIIGKLHWKKLK